MGKKIGPYLFLAFLFIIVVFIVGVRYGQFINTINRTVTPPVKPTTAPVPPISSPLEFKSYVSKLCALEFLYPSSLTVQESTREALLKGGKQHIHISCTEQNSMDKTLGDDHIATAELSFRRRPIKAKSTEDGSTYTFSFIHPNTGKRITVELSKTLFPLFDKSLSF